MQCGEGVCFPSRLSGQPHTTQPFQRVNTPLLAAKGVAIARFNLRPVHPASQLSSADPAPEHDHA